MDNRRPTDHRRGMTILDSLEWDGWALPRDTMVRVLEILDKMANSAPMNLLELGSGNSTVLLADWCRRHGSSLQTVEHNHEYLARTTNLLYQHDLMDQALVDLELATVRFNFDVRAPMYDAPFVGPYHFVLIDGPPATYGRQGTLPAIWELLPEGAVIVLDDFHRPHEGQCVVDWLRWFPELSVRAENVGRGLAILSKG